MISAKDLNPLADVHVKISVVLGKCKITTKKLLQLSKGLIIDLDKKIGEPVDIHVNNRIIARGEVVVVEDGQLGVAINEIVKGK